MTQAKRDQNNIPTILAVSETDGSTPVDIQAEASNHGVIVEDSTGGSDLTGNNALRDDNGEPTIMAVSEDDGVTPVPLYADPITKALLINSN